MLELGLIDGSTSVKTWWSDPYCVFLVRAVRAMSLPYKLLYSSVVLSPIVLTAAAFAQHDAKFGLGQAPTWIFGPLAAFYWFFLAVLSANHVRGRLALNRGIRASSPNTTNLYQPRWELFFWPAMIVLFGVLAIYGTVKHKSDPYPLIMIIIFATTFLTVLHQYALKKSLACSQFD